MAAEQQANPLKGADRPQGQGSSRFFFLVIVFMFWFSSYIYVPVLSPYVEHLGASYFMVGMVLGIYGLMQILFRIPIGIGSDYLNRRRPFIYLGLIASGVSCFLFMWGAQPGWALAARAVSGIAASAWVVYSVMFAGYFPKEEAGKAMGMLQFTTVIAQLTSMMISGYMVEHWGWNAPFLIGGIVAIAALILALRLPEQKQEKRQNAIQIKELAGVVKEPLLVRVSLLSVLAHCVLFITMFGYTPNQALNIGASKESLGWLTLAFMIPHAIATLYGSRLFGGLLGDRGKLMLGFAGSALFTLLIPSMPTLAALCLTQVGNGFMQGLIFPLLLSKSVSEIDPFKRATAMGFYQAVYAIGMSAGPFVAGWMSSVYGLTGGFWLGGIAAVLATILSWVWMKDTKQKQLKET
ncbi:MULTISPECIES: MFS transporter [unclassified Paenibacillus]|uniref:MFS transporter n=1 Tax=unclassified Paenibacillus TaxID=185978 RepID=UPI002474040D|nr:MULTISPECIES: MFS transporter [unclassified Paenibacillus]MDH6430653.1 MFS family permease [Paenibacillus sp. PastH-4]MDH6446652.1 MFS family permease [Paenibacillus sp. PastF-4]MDH6530890.1 MFS family permease [Paenibacillus sp. PastH-3]